VIVFLNGQFVPEEQATVSIFDRGFLYGDGLFETLLVQNGKPFRWTQHLERLRRGAEFLKIKLPFSPEELQKFRDDLISRNEMREGLLRLTLSRGVGLRGYSSNGADRPTLTMTLHPTSQNSSANEIGERWKLMTSSVRLPAGEALAQFKTCNKLSQILARAEADDAKVDEALLLNTDGFVVEGASSNLFWIEHDEVCTPPLVSGILSGVTRAVVLDICDSLQIKTREVNITPARLKMAEGVFLSLSSRGVMEAEFLDGVRLKLSPKIEQIRGAYWNLVQAETFYE